MSVLVKLGAPRENHGEGPRASLLACHARIRGNTSLALQLCDAVEAPAARVSDAAARIHRYFHEALPLHHADEEEVLRPMALAQVPGINAVLERIHAQHVALDAQLARLMPRWRQLAAHPGDIVVEGPAMRAEVEALQVLVEEHLLLEEEQVFVHIPSWPADVQARLLESIRNRRA